MAAYQRITTPQIVYSSQSRYVLNVIWFVSFAVKCRMEDVCVPYIAEAV